MERVQARVIGKAFRRTAPGGVITLSRRDARILESLGRVEVVADAGRSTYAYATDRQAEADVEFVASDRLDTALQTPEAPLATVAHTSKPKRAKAKTAKADKSEKPKAKRSRKKKAE